MSRLAYESAAKAAAPWTSGREPYLYGGNASEQKVAAQLQLRGIRMPAPLTSRQNSRNLQNESPSPTNRRLKPPVLEPRP
ncbi:hypothetical protein J3R74_002091 [Puniceicoccus vermicola]|uniref:Uncharacterized protein n=1 Tax=Puniceicoccus vermicola TaxID=388746 RepID=A0A7X1B2U3_9BACT|nr:hypothetical protein [Puniceicoccus vermicola]MBC2604359.1 hypothetical protein [Puniceicoccus vermicola]